MSMQDQVAQYKHFRTFLMSNPAQTQPVSRKHEDMRNTWVMKRDENVAIRLHQTDVAIFYPDGTIELDSGGWRTATTKDRIHQVLPGHLYLHQEKSVWYVSNRNTSEKVVFEDHMRILPDGSFQGAGDDTTADELQQLKKKIKKYAHDFTDAFFNGDVPAPSGGDCWYCSMKTEDGETLGDATNADHLLPHMEDEYYVPSLLYNAAKEAGASIATKGYIGQIWAGNKTPSEDDFIGSFAKREMKRFIIKYMQRRLNLAR